MRKKVLVVDDSAVMRKHIQTVLNKAGYEVLFAINGQDCLTQIALNKPDVVTLDINMPVMDGIACLKQIMTTNPLPVVMVSSLTRRGAIATLQALELGAIDYFAKPEGLNKHNVLDSELQLIEKVNAACQSKLRERSTFRNKYSALQQNNPNKPIESTQAISKPAQKHAKFDLIVIGASTGGPGCLQQILQNLPANFPVPIVVAQHMPARFTEVFSKRLHSLCQLMVTEILDTTVLKAGQIYIVRGDGDIEFSTQGSNILAKPMPIDKNFVWHPSVSKMVLSAMNTLPSERLMCVQLTGMGNDGAREIHQAHLKGAYTIAESSETAVVYGMPRELVELGGASHILANTKISDAILKAI